MANKLEEYWCNLNTHGETECKPANMFLLFIFFLIFLQTISNHSTARSREQSIADADASLSLARETHAKKKNTAPKQDLQAPSNSDEIVTRPDSRAQQSGLHATSTSVRSWVDGRIYVTALYHRVDSQIWQVPRPTGLASCNPSTF